MIFYELQEEVFKSTKQLIKQKVIILGLKNM